MQFQKTVTVEAAPDDVYSAVTDLSVLADCLPGARLAAVSPDGRTSGSMAVRVGAMSAQFDGEAWVSSRDDEDRTVEVMAEGAGARGRARAVIGATVVPAGDGSELRLVVDVDIEGQLARLGQGMARPVVDRLIEQFAIDLGARLAGRQPATVEAPDAGSAATRGEADVLDLGAALALPPAARRGVIALVALLIGALLVRLLQRPTPPTVVVYACGDVRHHSAGGEA